MLILFSINLNTVCNVKGNYAWSSEEPSQGGFPYETDGDARRLA